MKTKHFFKSILIIVILTHVSPFFGQDFEIIGDNWTKRRFVTDTIHSGNFFIGVNSNGGGYITQVSVPGVGNTMGVHSQKYGRGGQSSIRDLARGGQYNPTQAGFSDEGGTVCEVVKIDGKIVVPSRGCALFNGDGHFDYTRWENIVSDHPRITDNDSDQDNVDEENLSVVINGKTFTKQAAEVHSDFDFYCEYEDVKGKNNLAIPAIRHYLEYRFIRSSTLPNSAMKQFNIVALDAVGEWTPENLPEDISSEFPVGIHPGNIANVNSTSFSWSIRTDAAMWNPKYRYVQKNSGLWEISERTKNFRGNSNTHKLRFIVSNSNNENTGNALGFYLPDTYLNKYNVVGIKESDNSEVYVDNRTIENFYMDNPYRTAHMSWMGFRTQLKGLLDRSIISKSNPGVYEKLRREAIVLSGTPSEIKIAFEKLDNNYKTLSVSSNLNNISNQFKIFPNPSNKDVQLTLNATTSKIQVFNLLGVKIYDVVTSSTKAVIPRHQFKTIGVYFIRVNNTIKKLIIK